MRVISRKFGPSKMFKPSEKIRQIIAGSVDDHDGDLGPPGMDIALSGGVVDPEDAIPVSVRSAGGVEYLLSSVSVCGDAICVLYEPNSD